MSKRSGNFVTLADMVGEVGKDVVRFTMLTRKADAQMDFDFAKVVEASKDNPVFYVQSAHARIRSVNRKAEEAGMAIGVADLSRLDTDELSVVKLAAQFPRIVEAAALAREPHRIAFYLSDICLLYTSQSRGPDIESGKNGPARTWRYRQAPARPFARYQRAASVVACSMRSTSLRRNSTTLPALVPRTRPLLTTRRKDSAPG